MMYNREKGSDSMIYLQIGIFILEIILCIILNNLLKDKLNKKIRYAICIAFALNCWNMRTYQAMWAIHTLFCLLVLLTLFKKRKPIICMILSAIISTSKEDMEILFKQIGRLTKAAPVYFVYGNHENKIKFTKINSIKKSLKTTLSLLAEKTTQAKTERKQKTTILQITPTTLS